MSLFQTREWWHFRPDAPEECDNGCMCVANIDNSRDGKMKIITGNFQGTLRVLHPTEEGLGGAKGMPRLIPYLQSHLLLEHKFQEPILQLATGLFASGSNALCLAVLHPRKLAVYCVLSPQTQKSAYVRTSSTADVDSEFSSVVGGWSLSLLYTHPIPRSAFNMCVGLFTEASTQDCIVVQSMDGELYFFEQQALLFSRYLPSVIAPGPLCYISTTQSVCTVSSAMQLQCYSFQALALHKESPERVQSPKISLIPEKTNSTSPSDSEDEAEAADTFSPIFPTATSTSSALDSRLRRVQPTWTLDLGDHCISLFPARLARDKEVMAQYPFLPLDLVCVCEHSLTVLSPQGEVRWIKRLDFDPSAACPYTAYSLATQRNTASLASFVDDPRLQRGDADLYAAQMLLLSTHQHALLVYRDSKLAWASRHDAVGKGGVGALNVDGAALVQSAVADIGGLRGAVVSLFDNGHIVVSYMGTEPPPLQVTRTVGHADDYEAMAREQRRLMRALKAEQRESGPEMEVECVARGVAECGAEELNGALKAAVAQTAAETRGEVVTGTPVLGVAGVTLSRRSDCLTVAHWTDNALCSPANIADTNAGMVQHNLFAPARSADVPASANGAAGAGGQGEGQDAKAKGLGSMSMVNQRVWGYYGKGGRGSTAGGAGGGMREGKKVPVAYVTAEVEVRLRWCGDGHARNVHMTVAHTQAVVCSCSSLQYSMFPPPGDTPSAVYTHTLHLRASTHSVASTSLLEVHLSYVNEDNVLKTSTHSVALPLDLLVRAIPPIRAAPHALTLELNRARIPPVNMVFPDVLATGLMRFPQLSATQAGVVTLQHAHLPAHCTVIASKKGARYRLQSSHGSAAALVLQEMVDRLQLFYKYNPGYDGEEAERLVVRVVEKPDVKEWFRTVNIHYTARKEYIECVSRIEKMTKQYLAIERRIVARVKDKAAGISKKSGKPGDKKSESSDNSGDNSVSSVYNGLDRLLSATHTQLAALLAQAERLQQHIQYIRGTVAAATELLLLQTRLHYGMDSRSYEVLRAYMPPPGLDESCRCTRALQDAHLLPVNASSSSASTSSSSLVPSASSTVAAAHTLPDGTRVRRVCLHVPPLGPPSQVEVAQGEHEEGDGWEDTLYAGLSYLLMHVLDKKDAVYLRADRSCKLSDLSVLLMCVEDLLSELEKGARLYVKRDKEKEREKERAREAERAEEEQRLLQHMDVVGMQPEPEPDDVAEEDADAAANGEAGEGAAGEGPGDGTGYHAAGMALYVDVHAAEAQEGYMGADDGGHGAAANQGSQDGDTVDANGYPVAADGYDGHPGGASGDVGEGGYVGEDGVYYENGVAYAEAQYVERGDAQDGEHAACYTEAGQGHVALAMYAQEPQDGAEYTEQGYAEGEYTEGGSYDEGGSSDGLYGSRDYHAGGDGGSGGHDACEGAENGVGYYAEAEGGEGGVDCECCCGEGDECDGEYGDALANAEEKEEEVEVEVDVEVEDSTGLFIGEDGEYYIQTEEGMLAAVEALLVEDDGEGDEVWEGSEHGGDGNVKDEDDVYAEDGSTMYGEEGECVAPYAVDEEGRYYVRTENGEYVPWEGEEGEGKETQSTRQGEGDRENAEYTQGGVGEDGEEEEEEEWLLDADGQYYVCIGGECFRYEDYAAALAAETGVPNKGEVNSTDGKETDVEGNLDIVYNDDVDAAHAYYAEYVAYIAAYGSQEGEEPYMHLLGRPAKEVEGHPHALFAEYGPEVCYWDEASGAHARALYDPYLREYVVVEHLTKEDLDENGQPLVRYEAVFDAGHDAQRGAGSGHERGGEAREGKEAETTGRGEKEVLAAKQESEQSVVYAAVEEARDTTASASSSREEPPRAARKLKLKVASTGAGATAGTGVGTVVPASVTIPAGASAVRGDRSDARTSTSVPSISGDITHTSQ